MPHPGPWTRALCDVRNFGMNDSSFERNARSLSQNGLFTRREFIGTGIGVGFTLAVSPIAAWAITTPGEGLITGEVRIKGADGREFSAYRSMPRGKGPFPTLLVIHEIFGVHEYIQDVTRRLARQGYLAIAPDLYFRQGDVTKMTDIQKIITEVVAKVPQEQVLSDLDATVKWLGESKTSDLSRLGITGFCWGGNVTWIYASHQPKIKAAAAWYGPLTGEASAPGAPARKYPLEIAAALKAPVLGLYGGKDQKITAEHIEKMRQELKKGPSGSEIIVFPDAEHGFHADYRPSYNEKDAKDGWNKLLGWFKSHHVN